METKKYKIFTIYNAGNGASMQFHAVAGEPICEWLLRRIHKSMGIEPDPEKTLCPYGKFVLSRFNFSQSKTGKVYVVGPEPWGMPQEENADEPKLPGLDDDNATWKPVQGSQIPKPNSPTTEETKEETPEDEERGYLDENATTYLSDDEESA